MSQCVCVFFLLLYLFVFRRPHKVSALEAHFIFYNSIRNANEQILLIQNRKTNKTEINVLTDYLLAISLIQFDHCALHYFFHTEMFILKYFSTKFQYFLFFRFCFCQKVSTTILLLLWCSNTTLSTI